MINKKMNVVFIMTDQQRADSIGPNRHVCANYPNMERLRSESVNFNSFYTVAAPCVPSRYSFLTGRQPWTGCFGNMKFYYGNDETTWMSILRDNGYRCVSVGKTHMIHAGSFHIQIPVGSTFGDQGGWNHFNPAPSPENEENYFDIHTTRRTCEALSKLSDSPGPFALFIGFHAPHEPYVMPRRYLGFCNPDNVPLPEARCEAEYKNKSEAYRRRIGLFKRKFGNIDDNMVRSGIAGHYCILKMVDDCLGVIMSKLDELKLMDNTLIVYTADHGDLLGEHWLFNKGATFHEGETHIPFMIRFPNQYMAGTNVQSLASSLDFVPTVLDILGISADVSLPGISLMPAIEKGEQTRKYITCSTANAFMIRTSHHKLWYNYETQDGEMYDLLNDPNELNNLYNNNEYFELRRELFELLLHARMLDDAKSNAPTRYEMRLKSEIHCSGEPEI